MWPPNVPLVQHKILARRLLYNQVKFIGIWSLEIDPKFVHFFRGGVLYQFSHPNDRVPMLKMSLSEEECKGYGRNFHSKRPHTIELQFRDDKSLLLAAASESEATDWLTSLSQSSFIWDNMASGLSVPVACGVLVTRQQVFLFKTEEIDRPVASAPLDIISVVMISPEDTFCLIVMILISNQFGI